MIITHESFGENKNMIKFGTMDGALFSYSTLVLLNVNNTTYIDKTNYSKTTAKHIASMPKYTNIIKVTPEQLQQKLQLYMTSKVLGI